MSDKKISQLPASTTPLAGTEELAIVQSGDTKKVSVSNLTAGRAVDVSSLTVATDIVSTAGKFATNAAGQSVGLQLDSYVDGNVFNNYVLNNSASAGTKAALNFGRGTSLLYGFIRSNNNSQGLELGTSANANVSLYANNNEKVTLHASGGVSVGDTTDPGAGNLRVGNGNLVIGTSGKGIDFSADSSAAGMTSELLDDYEEGTWTPTIAFDGASVGVTYFAQTGTYTKIGNTVTVTGNLYIDSNGSSTGSLEIRGFPFAANSYSSISLSIRSGMTYTGMVLAYINVAEARASVEQISEIAVGSPITQANLFNPQILFTCTYTTNS